MGWLNSPNNRRIFNEILKYESDKDEKYFMKDGDRLVATGYLHNQYFNDVGNLTPPSATINLLKTNKDLYPLLIAHSLFGDAFAKVVREANKAKRSSKFDCIDLITEKVGGKPTIQF